MTNLPEVWLRGPLPEYPPLLLPVAHALLQAREDIERLAATVPAEHVWLKPGGAASIGFHIVHIAGSIDRLCTYARGEMLDEAQLRFLKAESSAEESGTSLAATAAQALATIDRALEQLRRTPAWSLLEPRAVGRGKLPSTVIGLLVHVAEHTTRHVGQAITTASILAARAQPGLGARGLGLGLGRPPREPGQESPSPESRDPNPESRVPSPDLLDAVSEALAGVLHRHLLPLAVKLIVPA